MAENSLTEAEVFFYSRVQEILKLSCRKRFKIRKICCVDSSYSDGMVKTVAVLSDSENINEVSSYTDRCRFPYHPGLFFLREGPPSVEAVRRLKSKPDVVCFDAHGRIHPRGAGMAIICGAVLSMPSVGIAKSPFVGTEIPFRQGISKIVYNGETVGFATSFYKKKRYWSPGFCFSINSLLKFIEDYWQISMKAMTVAHRLASSRKSA